MKKFISLALFLAVSAVSLHSKVSQTTIDFRPVIDSMAVLMQERTTVEVELKLKNVVARGTSLDFFFSETLGDYPWRKDDVTWFRTRLKELFPEKYASYAVGSLMVKNHNLNEYPMPPLANDGKPFSSQFRTEERRFVEPPLVCRKDSKIYSKGLSDRHIALWQSHGLYHDSQSGQWIWQRPPLFQTVEDLFTQSFVLPYLVPMLENAGANVLLPRERDCSTVEVIAHPKIEEEGQKASWAPLLPERGPHALYVTYSTTPTSSSKVVYTVSHLGGKTSFEVNQKMGGGIWIYLGSFDFAKGDKNTITMRNADESGTTASAGNIKIGGGIGVSGRPRFVEGAKYWMQYSGVDRTVWDQNNGLDDYRDDFMSRGPWVSYLSAGSVANPGKFLPPLNGSREQPAEREGLHIPLDLSFGFHSDAGLFQGDTIVGTLAIYTLMKDGKDQLPTGENRLSQRSYADIVQTQVVSDIRAQFDSQWARRETWDRSYSESRTPSVPAMLLELMSHQNFADMKYGLDPSFRFTVSRAVYKGMLKFLSNRYGCQYAVQPLPVNSFSAMLMDGNKVRLSWKETPDSLEPTARASSYVLYKRVDDGGFDNGREVQGNTIIDNILPGHIYSYKVEAQNDGGRSFPSEILAVGLPEAGGASTVLVVNNFTRVSGPDVVDTPAFAGFDGRRDSGVPYLMDISYIGDMYEWDRSAEFVTNDNPGFGASYMDFADLVVAGNSFDFVFRHGQSILKSGRCFSSCSVEAFCGLDHLASVKSIDLICGKQRSTLVGRGQKGAKFTVFTDPLMMALKNAVDQGKNILISGAFIATDPDNDFIARGFAKNVLGYTLASGYGSRNAHVLAVEKSRTGAYSAKVKGFAYNNHPSDKIYCVESPDGIEAASKRGKTIYRYADSGVSAGICTEGSNGYRVVALGFPIESVTDDEAIDDIVAQALKYMENRQ